MTTRVGRDKCKPKGAMSSYACFVQVIREEHRKKHPNEQVVFSEFAKKCAEKWKQMTPEEKRRFDEMAELDKSRHVKEMDEYMSSKTVKKAKKRRTKDPNEPKRAWSAFFFYSNEFRPKIMQDHPDWKVGDVAKELGRRWELCTDKERYEDMAKNDKERYNKDMESFKAGLYIPPKIGKSSHCIVEPDKNEPS